VQYSRQGRDISAINEYKLAIALDPANAEYHRRLGDAYLKTGRYHEADEQFEIARGLEPADENGP
jgi:Flp pilus assembly protein TadD